MCPRAVPPSQVMRGTRITGSRTRKRRATRADARRDRHGVGRSRRERSDPDDRRSRRRRVATRGGGDDCRRLESAGRTARPEAGHPAAPEGGPGRAAGLGSCRTPARINAVLRFAPSRPRQPRTCGVRKSIRHARCLAPATLRCLPASARLRVGRRKSATPRREPDCADPTPADESATRERPPRAPRRRRRGPSQAP
jgi:hypothetical protein